MRHGSDPAVSIIMVTYGAWNWAERAIAAVLANTEVEHELIVVDNASPDGTAGHVRERFPEVRLIANGTNTGFGPANNQAAAVARGEILAFLNSDAITPPGWIAPLLHALDTRGVGAVVPALTNPDGTLQVAGALVAPDGSVLALGNGDNPDEDAYRFPRATDFGAAACMLMRRDVFLSAGGFHEGYHLAYFEDVDLCLTIGELGLRTFYVPDVRVVHGGFSSGGQEAAAELFRRNQRLFVKRWGERLARTHPATLWPPKAASTLAARDASATGRLLVLVDRMPDPNSALGTAIGDTLDVLPWARVTVVASTGAADPWWSRGVEAFRRSDPTIALAERAGHYDVVVADEDRSPAVREHQPQAVHVVDAEGLGSALDRLRSRARGHARLGLSRLARR